MAPQYPIKATEPPIIGVDEVLEVVGLGRFRITDDGELERAGDGATARVLADIGAVIKVQRSDIRFDLCMVEEDTIAEEEANGATASLTELRLID